MKKIFLETFGCQMNVLDSQLVEGHLRSSGYAFTADSAAADVVLYNTCSIRDLAEQKVLSRLGRMRQRKLTEPDLVVGVIGCMAERDGARMLKRLPQVDLLCGPGELDRLPELLADVFRTGRQQQALAGNSVRRSGTRDASRDDALEMLDLSRTFSAEESGNQAYIRIVRGCNKFCTYCVVPYTRGPEVSRSPDAILQEARKLVDAGCREITLLGQTVNHYVYDHGPACAPGGPAPRRTRFSELLRQLHDALPDLPRLRFVTSFPADFGDDILQAMADCPRICRYLHIPAQTGSNRLLKMMNRGYTVESYLELLARARAMAPRLAFGGDIIAGFPTETEADHAATARLLTAARYKNCFIFKYSPRPGTAAMRRYPDDVPNDVKRARNNALLELQNQICLELNQEVVGQTVEALCEGPSGWQRGGDSVVTGAIPATPATQDAPEISNATPGPVKIELGAGLRDAMARRGNGSASAAFTEVATAPARPAAGASGLCNAGAPVQLIGRTSQDQIVVFQGPPGWRGQIVSVRIANAHKLTLFGEATATAALERVRA